MSKWKDKTRREAKKWGLDLDLVYAAAWRVANDKRRKRKTLDEVAIEYERLKAKETAQHG